ncbi:Retrotransposable element Tf2 [Gossypium australe]|uniref:Retrotransposable element Tf2 n=1 Tax=Gossypium australe TaxID=47621 RepID=A0A5B6VJ50_9ROSI|nr:Retrotransposable element Tf2 [Gossypium australe]
MDFIEGLPASKVNNTILVVVNRLTNKFWLELFKRLGTNLHMTTTYHPETDGQIEVLNKYLEGYL